MTLKTPADRRRPEIIWLTIALLSTVGACSDSTAPASATPSDIAVVSGSGQTGSVGTTLASPVVFEVTSASSAPIQGRTVTFAVTSGSATVAPASAITDEDGQ